MVLFEDSLVENLPYLRTFARFLVRNQALADDLVQETAVRALTNIDKFTPGTNMKAWLSTIPRNQFYNDLRSRSRSDAYVALPISTGRSIDQEIRLEIVI